MKDNFLLIIIEEIKALLYLVKIPESDSESIETGSTNYFEDEELSIVVRDMN